MSTDPPDHRRVLSTDRWRERHAAYGHDADHRADRAAPAAEPGPAAAIGAPTAEPGGGAAARASFASGEPLAAVER